MERNTRQRAAILEALQEANRPLTPQEILETDPTFLRDVGITQHLSANRRNALTRVGRIIHQFAAANNGVVG